MKKIQILLICSGLILSFWAGLVYASDDLAEEIILYVGQIKTFSIDTPTRIVVGKPEVADVTVATEKEITVTAKSLGTTTFVVWDNFGEQSYNIKVFTENINEVKERIDNLLSKLNLSEVYTKAEDDEGKVILLGRVKSAQDRERITLALGPLKEKTVDLIEVKEEEALVEIDVNVLELNKDATNTLGLTWPGAINLAEISSPGLSGTKFSTLFKVLNLERGTVSSGTYTSDPFVFKLDALVQEGKARILSRPRLSCQSGKEAELLVGGEKPIFTTQTVSGGGTGTQVEYKEFGIKLKIKPTVTQEKRIKVALSVEVSEVGAAEFIGLTTQRTAQAYPLSKRNASTELFLNDGQTMAIGGLIKQKAEEDIRKTPILGDIPILGLFFRKKTTKIGGGAGERGDTELFITLTPRIVSEEKKAAEDRKEIKPKISSSGIGSTSENLPESMAVYARIIQKRILENLIYPALAKEAGFQGTVKLSLRLSYQGELLEAKVKQPSSYKIFDDQALNVVKGIVSYPPFPPSIDEKELWIDIPIVYSLD